MSGPFTQLDHVVIAVRDLDVAAVTYAALLGREASWRGVHPRLGTHNALFRLENGYVELLAPGPETGPLGRALGERLAREGEGLVALALRTDDARACARVLRERGLEPGEPEEGSGRAAGGAAERRWLRVPLPGARTRGVALFAIEHRSPDASLPLREPQAAADACVSAFDHVVITTPAPDAAIPLYRDGLGLRLALDRAFPQWGVRLLFFRLGGVTVELAARLDAAAQADAPDRLWGVSYRVGDVEAARERVAAAGFDVSEQRRGRRPGTRVCTVRGETHGVATLLIGPEPGGG